MIFLTGTTVPRHRDLRHRHQLGVIVEQSLVFVDHDLTRFVDRNHPEFRALLVCQCLPGDDVGVMLEMRNDHFRRPGQCWPRPNC
jgi:hypothetical protein